MNLHVKPRRRGPALEAVDAHGFRAPTADRMPVVVTGTAAGPLASAARVNMRPTPTEIPQEIRDRLALALHHRWHGPERPDFTPAKELRCAHLAGAGDDVASIEPVILDWVRTLR